MIAPAKVKAGDQKVLINGNPPWRDIRLVSEENWTNLWESHKQLVKVLEELPRWVVDKHIAKEALKKAEQALQTAKNL